MRVRASVCVNRGLVAAAVAVCAALAASNPRAQAAPGNLTPGERIVVRPQDMPAPYATPSVSNSAARIARPAGAGLMVPRGFAATLFAEGLDNPRNLIVAPNGDLILAESRPGKIIVLRDGDGDGKAESRFEYAGGASRPFGLALQPEGLYIADTEAVWRFEYAVGDTRARSLPVRVTPPGAFGGSFGHWTRNLAFSADGRRFFVAIGSSGNIGEDATPRATIQEFHRDGSHQRTFAAGMRNAVGLAVHPHTGQLFAVVNERDGLGDGLVPDYLADVKDGDFFGWPYAYIGPHRQPGYADRRPDLVAKTRLPDTLFKSHSAPIGMAIYTGAQFPERYRDGFFVALQGSWNSQVPTGYMVAFVPAQRRADGSIQPDAAYEVFATGFWISGAERATIWGQPAGVAVAPDGSLYVTDDVSGTVWRIAWRG